MSDKTLGVLERPHFARQFGRIEVEGADRISVGVVVETDAQLLQRGSLTRTKPNRARPPRGNFGQPVAERRHDRPGAMASIEIAVDQNAGADVARLLDVRLETRVLGQLTRVMMVEIAHQRPATEQPEQGGAVPVERDVEHRNFITCYRVDALEQPDIAFDAGDERCISGLAET